MQLEKKETWADTNVVNWKLGVGKRYLLCPSIKTHMLCKRKQVIHTQKIKLSLGNVSLIYFNFESACIFRFYISSFSKILNEREGLVDTD